MYFRSRAPIFTNVSSRAFLNAIPGALGGGICANATVHLLADMTGLTADSLYADFLALECTFTGYAPDAPNFAGPVRLAPNLWVTNLLSAGAFTAADPLTSGPQNALGYWVDDGSADPVLLFEAFPAPIPFAAPYDFLDLQVVIPFSQAVIVP